MVINHTQYLIYYIKNGGNNNMYIFKKWNGKYGNGAKFVVEDESNGKQSMFTPSNPSDLAWTSQDLTKDSEVSSWEDFGNEKVNDLKEVVF